MGKIKTVLLINDTGKFEYHIGCISLVKTIRRLCKENNMRISRTITRDKVSDDTTENLIKILNSADIIIINGEGSLHDHPRRNTKWFQRILTLLPNDKPAVLINSVWQGMKNIQDLNKLKLISVRESLSYNELITNYPNLKNVIITPDIIFATPINLLKIGYSDCVFHDTKKLLRKNQNYFPLSYVARGSYKNIKALEIPTFNAYCNWLKSLELHVTGRFHGLCASALVGTPFLAFNSNTHKIKGILKDMGCSELLINSLEEIPIKKEKAKKLIVKAHKYAIEAQEKLNNLFERISEL